MLERAETYYMYIYIYIYIYDIYIYIYIYIWKLQTNQLRGDPVRTAISSTPCTPNLPTNIADFRAARLEHNLNLKGWNSQAHMDFLWIFRESLTQAMLVGTMLVGRLGVRPSGMCRLLLTCSICLCCRTACYTYLAWLLFGRVLSCRVLSAHGCCVCILVIVLFVFIVLSLSLCIYIYIHIHTYMYI